MSATATKIQSSQLRQEDAAHGGGRYKQFQIDWRDDETDALLLRVGGVWDARVKRFTGERAAESLVFRFTAAQRDATLWLVEWLKAYARGERHKEGGKTIYSVLLGGGRRGGKTDLLWKFMFTFSAMVPDARVWIVSPSIPETEELEQAIDESMPRGWTYKLGAPWFRYKMLNGAKLTLRSGFVPRKLKRGRVDACGINEGQNIDHRTYIHVRAPIADTGGLVLIAANPPDTELGQWVLDYQEKAIARKIHGRFFPIDPRKNPYIDDEALTSMRDEIDLRTYQIEILGQFLPRADVVFYSFSEDNLVPVPILGDCTRQFLIERFGGDGRFTDMCGMDFQRTPYCCAVFFRAFNNPTGGKPLLWVTDEVIVEKGDENDLVDAMERKGYKPETTCVVADASGDWQDADHTRGRTSFDTLRKRGWIWLWKPDPASKRNPEVLDRIANGNALLRSVVLDDKLQLKGFRHHLFVDPSCYYVTQTLKKWSNRNGFPYKRSDFAHIGDALTYPLFFCYPRRLERSTIEYESLNTNRRADELDGY